MRVGVRLGVRPDRGWNQGAPALKLKLNAPLMPTLQVTKLNAISILSGLAVVLVNWLVTVAVRKVRSLERECWHPGPLHK
jgi:hypothetical protein